MYMYLALLLEDFTLQRILSLIAGTLGLASPNVIGSIPYLFVIKPPPEAIASLRFQKTAVCNAVSSHFTIDTNIQTNIVKTLRFADVTLSYV